MFTLNMWMERTGMDENKVAKMLFAIIQREQKRKPKQELDRAQHTCTDEYEARYGFRKTTFKPKPVTEEEKRHRAEMWGMLNGGSAPEPKRIT